MTEHELRQYIDVISDYDTAIHLNPDNAEVYFYREQAKACIGDRYGAISDYDTAILHQPDYVSAHITRATREYKVDSLLARRSQQCIQQEIA